VNDASSNLQKERAREPRTGLATSILGWVQAVYSNGFAGLGKARSERRMELLETLQLGGKRQLMLVACDGRRYLVGTGGDSVHAITELNGAPQVDDALGSVAEGPSGYETIAEPPCSKQEVRCS
jgi:hypothetical protein